MPVSKETTADTQVPGMNPLFPPTLVDKKLDRTDDGKNGISEHCLAYLEQYLETRNPDFLVKAIREYPSLTKGKGRNLDVEDYLTEKEDSSITPTQFVDGFTISGETIRWWQHLHQWMGDADEAKLAKKYLSKILAPTDILTRKERNLLVVKDGLKHITEKEKGKKPYLTYNVTAQEFIESYENAKSVFQKTKSKKKYGLFEKVLVQKDTLKALKLLSYERIDNIIPAYFNLSNAHTKAISFLNMVHREYCPNCKNRLSDDTILRVLNRAKKEVRSQQPQK